MDYEALKELIRLISRHKAKDIELLGRSEDVDAQPKLNQLYDGIMKGVFASDDAAAAALYGQDATASHPEYRRIRNRLIRQLLNTSFFMDMHQPIYTERARMSYQIYKDFAAASLLLSRDARQAGLYLMSQVVEMGMKYEFTELVADASRLIRSSASGSLGDLAQHEKYTQIHREFENKRRLEADAFEEYQKIVRFFLGGTATNKELHQYTSTVFPILLEKAPTVDTVNYYFYTYFVGLAHYSSINDAENALRLADEAIEIISKKEQFVQGKMLGFVLNKLHFMTQLRRFNEEESLKTYQLCLSQVTEGETNWFKTLQFWLHYNLHAGNYAKSFEIYLQAVTHPRFPLMTGMTSEIWDIYYGYFQLLSELKYFHPVEKLSEFKPGKFINNFPVLSREKDGLYIPILMLPVIFSLLQTGEKKEIKSEDALDKFRQRHLQNDINLRSAIFIKLLLALAKRPYEAKATKKIKTELELLKNNPIEKAGQSYTVEIIPYETLWEMLDKACK